MKFAAFAVLALASVASAAYNFGPGTRVFGGQSTYDLVLPKGNPVEARAAVASPVRAAQAAQYVAVAQPQVQYVQVAQPQVQYVALQQAQPQVQYVAVQQAQPVQYVQAAAQATNAPIQAAVQTKYSLQFVDVPSSRSVAAPQSIVIGPSVNPLEFEFQSQSSPISVRQTHIPGTPNPPQFSSHQEEPDQLKQEIVKPIIHEVTEAIQPFRKITQEVRPVQETINQIITRGQEVQKVQAVVQQAVQAVAQPVQTIAVQAVQPVSVQAVSAPVSTVELVEADSAPLLTGAQLSGAQFSGAQFIALKPNQLQGFGLSGSLQAIRKKK